MKQSIYPQNQRKKETIHCTFIPSKRIGRYQELSSARISKRKYSETYKIQSIRRKESG